MVSNWTVQRTQLFRFLMLTVFLIGLASCASQPSQYSYDPPGFFTALWHGFTAPFALIGGLFSDVRVYAFPNSGIGYDWGYKIGSLFSIGWLGIFAK